MTMHNLSIAVKAASGSTLCNGKDGVDRFIRVTVPRAKKPAKDSKDHLLSMPRDQIRELGPSEWIRMVLRWVLFRGGLLSRLRLLLVVAGLA
jgi:hypothetical protein